MIIIKISVLSHLPSSTHLTINHHLIISLLLLFLVKILPILQSDFLYFEMWDGKIRCEMDDGRWWDVMVRWYKKELKKSHLIYHLISLKPKSETIESFSPILLSSSLNENLLFMIRLRYWYERLIISHLPSSHLI